MNGLTSLNIELTNKCNKNCWMCGRRKAEKKGIVYNEEMGLDTIFKINNQIPHGIVLQFHNNGEPLLFSYLYRVLDGFKNNIRCFDTNGKLLVQKEKKIINNCELITVSIFENDSEADEQYAILKDFLRIKRNRKPQVILRILGNVDETRYKELNCLIVRRVLHSPDGSFDYKKKTVIPEIGICLDLLNKMCINVDGTVSACVRFDIERQNIIGDLKTETLKDIWYGKKRQELLGLHLAGKRNEIPFCNKCDYWGIPRG